MMNRPLGILVMLFAIAPLWASWWLLREWALASIPMGPYSASGSISLAGVQFRGWHVALPIGGMLLAAAAVLWLGWTLWRSRD